MSQHQVTVGNVGTVYSGPSSIAASQAFLGYVEASKANSGRAAGEPVTWMKDGEIIKEHSPAPKPITLYPFDNTIALIEGWDLFDVDGRLQLQRIDDPASLPELSYSEPKFDSDAAAIIHVALLASHGSAYHRFALDLIGTLAEDAHRRT